MEKNLKKALDYIFYFTGMSCPESEKYYEKPDWFLKHTWTAKQQEKYTEWLSKSLEKNWRGIVEVRPNNKKIRDAVANEFVNQYGFKTRPLTIKDFTPLVPEGQLKEMMSKEELEKWNNWARGNTMSLHGVYRWDLESFLRGERNWD